MTTAALLLGAGLVLISAGLKARDRHDAALCEWANATDDGGEV